MVSVSFAPAVEVANFEPGSLGSVLFSFGIV
jgi:hypothetical protein